MQTNTRVQPHCVVLPLCHTTKLPSTQQRHASLQISEVAALILAAQTALLAAIAANSPRLSSTNQCLTLIDALCTANLLIPMHKPDLRHTPASSCALMQQAVSALRAG
jgi:hypothetical protein